MQLKPKKSLGQNFLHDKNIIDKIIHASNIDSNDEILEVGPGTGNLTELIVSQNPKKIDVIEKDKNLASILEEKFLNKINIITEDILRLPVEFYSRRKFLILGNLPYNISTKILTSFIKIENLRDFYEKFIFIFQKEVADRILANEDSKNYGRLSIITSWKMRSNKIFDINPKYFFPKPKVWSTVINLEPKLKYENLISSKNLEHITNIFFSQRRKMIKKPMRQLFNNYDEIANKLDIDLNLRPQNISTENYLKICKIYENLTC